MNKNKVYILNLTYWDSKNREHHHTLGAFTTMYEAVMAMDIQSESLQIDMDLMECEVNRGIYFMRTCYQECGSVGFELCIEQMYQCNDWRLYETFNIAI